MMKKMNPPKVENVVELRKNIPEIIKWTDQNPNSDFIYHLIPDLTDDQISEKLSYFSHLSDQNGCVAGSAALHMFLDRYIWGDLFSEYRTEGTINPNLFNPGDVDIFFLGQENNARLQVSMTDIVLIKDKTVYQMLMNFDQPICRVAYNFSFEIWISAQCIRACLLGNQYLPKYLKNYRSFQNLIRQNKHDNSGSDSHKFLYYRFNQRVKKYERRGCKPNWIPCRELIPWVKNRFHYGEWKNQFEHPKTQTVNRSNNQAQLRSKNRTQARTKNQAQTRPKTNRSIQQDPKWKRGTT